MVFLPPAVSFWALKSIWSWVIFIRSDLRALTAAATALKRARASSSLDVSAVLRFTFLRRYTRLRWGFRLLRYGGYQAASLRKSVEGYCPVLIMRRIRYRYRHSILHEPFRVRQSDRKGPYHSAKWRGRPFSRSAQAPRLPSLFEAKSQLASPPLSPKIRNFRDPLCRLRGIKSLD